MHNIVYLIGRLTNIEEIEERKIITTLEVQKTLINEEGKYETDLIPCVLYSNMAIHTKEYCVLGDLIGVKGRLEINDNKMIVVADKITFLSSKKVEEEGN